DRAVSGTSQHFFHRDVDAQLGEALEDGVVALLPAPAQVRQTVLERSGLVVDPQDDHVHAAAPVGVGDHAGPVEGQLDAGDQLDVVALGGLPGLLQSREDVVVGQGHGPQAGVGGQPDDLGRSLGAVRYVRVGV